MSAILEAKTAMRQLAEQAQEVTKNPRLRPETKTAKLDEIEAAIKAHAKTIEMHEQAGRLASGGSSADSMEGVGAYTGKSFGLPSLAPDDEQVKALHHAATTKQSLRVEVGTKAASDLGSLLPSSLVPGILAFRREPTRVASLFPTVAESAPSFEYIRHTGNSSGAAATVAAGGAKPEIVPTIDQVTATMRKIAAHLGVVDESLMDFASTASYFSSELTQAIIAAENTQLLSGNGTAPNLQGVLTTTGVLTRTQAAAPETAIDTLELALNDLRVGSSFTEATGFVMNPNDWSAIRLLKDTQNRYLLGAPAESDGLMLWGKPVVLTTSITAKTVLVGDFASGGQVRYRQGITLETQSAGTDWTNNVTRFRAEERLALAVFRPTCFVKVTLS